jgi:Pentapeptide repeats (8 copies)
MPPSPVVIFILVMVAFVAAISSGLSLQHSGRGEWFKLVSIQLIGSLVTVSLIALVVYDAGERQFERNQTVLKSQLIVQLGSLDNARAIEAAKLLDSYGWLHDGSLEGAMLQKADLQNAVLMNADLRGVYLSGANLQGAILIVVDLQNAELSQTDLRGARLYNANLVGAQLGSAIFDEHTELPDLNFWTPDTDMTRFTDPHNPDFWHPSVVLVGPPWWAGHLAESLQTATPVPTPPAFIPSL